MSRTRILVATAAFGDGHNSAATNIASALRAQGAITETMDVFEDAVPAFFEFLKDGYRTAITHTPKIWQGLYALSENLDFERPSIDIYGDLRAALRRRLDDFQPDAVISTYPLYPQLYNRVLRPNETAPIFTVITDSVSINRTWLASKSEAYHVTEEISKGVLAEHGIPEASIHVTGFAVSPAFVELTRGGLRDRSGLDRILYIPSTSGRHVRRTLLSLLADAPEHTALTIVLGRHARRLAWDVERIVDEHRDGRDIDILPWCDNIPELMCEHDAIITKAGGATIHESFAAAIPPIINYVVPGQEEGNADHVTDLGCGVRITDPKTTGRTLREMHHSGEWATICESMRNHHRPDGAITIARHILDHLSGI